MTFKNGVDTIAPTVVAQESSTPDNKITLKFSENVKLKTGASEWSNLADAASFTDTQKAYFFKALVTSTADLSSELTSLTGDNLTFEISGNELTITIADGALGTSAVIGDDLTWHFTTTIKDEAGNACTTANDTNDTLTVTASTGEVTYNVVS